jgi:hypothetical protein
VIGETRPPDQQWKTVEALQRAIDNCLMQFVRYQRLSPYELPLKYLNYSDLLALPSGDL